MKPGYGQQRPQVRQRKLALPQLVIQRHQRKLAFIPQNAALPEQPLGLLQTDAMLSICADS